MASHTLTHTHSHTHTGDAQAQTLGCCISVMSEPKLLRSQAETLGCSSILSSSDCVLSWLHLSSLFSLFTLFFKFQSSFFSLLFLSALCLLFLSPLFSYPSLFSSPSLPLFVSPSLLCWCCISQRDRLKQMPSWETGYVCVFVCVRARVSARVRCLHKLTHRRHAHNGSFPQMGEG